MERFFRRTGTAQTLLVSLSTGGMILAGCGRAAPSGPPVVLPLPKPGTDGSYRLTTDELYESYRVDGKATDKLLRGKTVVVDGYVVLEYSDVEVNQKRKKSGGPTNPDLFLQVNHKSNGFWVSSNGVVCNFPDSARPQLIKFIKNIQRYDRAIVRGKVGLKFGDVFLEGCSLEGKADSSDTPSPAGTPPAMRPR